MKKIAFFCIPAHGHHNPMLPVAAELIKRGNQVRFYSFGEFKDKIEATGAQYISCDKYLPELTAEEEAALKSVTISQMAIQDIRITINMNDFLEQEFKSFKPDVVYTDSACFWGKLNACKFGVPMVVSTSTFAFNQLSSKYMKNSPKELSDMIFGLPKISKEMKTLEPYGYPQKGALELVQSDNNTDSVVYTSRKFQPFSESFSDHYAFVGPSVFSKEMPHKDKDRPLVYISMGTVINDRPDFYNKCIDALKSLNVDVIISCGKEMDIDKLGALPENVKVYPYVNQLEVLAKAEAFITHCGMNSVSESLYMATPLVLYPQTAEQFAVARSAEENGAGVMLKDDSVEGIKKAVQEVLNNSSYVKAAQEFCDDFRSCSGTAGAAEFIENAPHKSEGVDIIKKFNSTNGIFQLIYWLIASTLILLFGFFITWNYAWIVGLVAGIFNYKVQTATEKFRYKKVVEKYAKK